MSTAPQTSQPPTPERLFGAINAFHQTEAIKAAINLGLFTTIAEGHTTAAAIADRVSAKERGVRILCDYLTIQGFLTKSGSDYGLAPDTAFFLDRRSPAYLGSIAEFLASDQTRQAHSLIGDSVRKGGSAVPETPFEPDDPRWILFARVMMPLMFMPAQMMAKILTAEAPVRNVLDIAASHGIFGISVAKLNPDAEVFAVDWPKVLEVAKENASAMGVAPRHHLMPGSAFDVDFGTGYDLALITNFLHHFDVPTCTSFMRKICDALEPGGRAAILEFVPNPDRVSPPMPAAFSLIMLSSTPAGDAYTFAELESMCRDAGFSRVTQHPSPLGVESLIVAYK